MQRVRPVHLTEVRKTVFFLLEKEEIKSEVGPSFVPTRTREILRGICGLYVFYFS